MTGDLVFRRTAISVSLLLCLIPWSKLSIADESSTDKTDQPIFWKAGVAKAVITPEKAVWLAGYGSKRAPDGKLHDLWMYLSGSSASLISRGTK
jgi:hypothetical protein